MSFFCISESVTAEDLGDDDDIAVLIASGEIDYGASPQLRENILKHINAGRHVLLDLATVTFIDSTAIGVIVAAAVRLNKTDSPPLTVVCPLHNQQVLRILDIAGVPNVVTLHHARDDALAALTVAS